TGLRPEPTLLFVGTVGEEAGGMPGAIRFREWAMNRGLEIDQLIAAEPTQLAPVHGHKGAVAMRITATGLASHSAVPHLGENAIEAMAPVISAMQAEHERLIAGPTDRELGTATLSVTGVEGGTGGNVIPDRCEIVVVRRNVPVDDPDAEYERLSQLAHDACPLPVEIESLIPPLPDGRQGSSGFYTPPDTELAQGLATWAGTVPTVAPFGTNASRYPDLAREMVVFGPGRIEDAHQATEHVSIADLVALADVYTRWLDPR
ncbi:MAG: M20 family metallopeptidase, partial [Actinomycetia bacterium]|nr:M20 family metallopeptidase [Actinomycetes bacterium]